MNATPKTVTVTKVTGVTLELTKEEAVALKELFGHCCAKQLYECLTYLNAKPSPESLRLFSPLEGGGALGSKLYEALRVALLG